MSFANPFSIKTPGVTTIGAGEVNAAGASISKAIDGTGGGSYAPVSKIQVAGSGIEFSAGSWPLLSTRQILRSRPMILGSSCYEISTKEPLAMVGQSRGDNVGNSGPAIEFKCGNTGSAYDSVSFVYFDVPEASMLDKVTVGVIIDGVANADQPAEFTPVKTSWGDTVAIGATVLDPHTALNYDSVIAVELEISPGNKLISHDPYTYGVCIKHPYWSAPGTQSRLRMVQLLTTCTVTSLQY